MYRKTHIVICGFFPFNLSLSQTEINEAGRCGSLWSFSLYKQHRVEKEKPEWMYLGGKTVNDTYCLEGYALKITGCVQMILVQQGICCKLWESRVDIWGVCQRTYTPRQTREHLGNRDNKGPAKLCSASW